MKKWFHKEKEYSKLEDFPEDCFGFVYKITNVCSGRVYVGRKVLYNNLTKALTKTEIAQWSAPGRVPKKRKVKKESDWESYWGSNKHLKLDMAELGEHCFTREVLTVCKTKKQLTYYEIYWQMRLDVLSIDSYNDNISGKFYRKDLE